ncbi:low choriolytic enzyme-like [Drosophila novamexicana]|uniref:low choriolytic enzyme-like n=1 Tax=Drosophila novamexicana TaxID=47314 RepID=UPI0011E5C6B3|nr:low choriolytic enzyme-like [Drosophila novamexicana]
MHRFILFSVLVQALVQAVPLIFHEETTEYGIDDPDPRSKDIIDLSFYGSSLLGKPDEEQTGALVGNFSADTDEVNPEELGSYLEGDMLVPETAITMKNGLITQTSRWPGGVVPYKIRGTFNALELAVIQGAIEEYHRRTCIRFVPHKGERDYISIINDFSGCWSAVGRVGGQQKINLQTPGCLGRPGTVLHELMHALGFLHEQSRKERDDYVAIQYMNVRWRALRNFRKVDNTEAFGVPYDYGSVMHYSKRAFSFNGQPTIVAKQADGANRMGQRLGFSDLDIEKLHRMYDCGAQETTVPATEAEASTTVSVNSTATTTATSPNPEVEGFNSTLSGLVDGQKELGRATDQRL